MAETEDQQFCLRWNNFQANITSQFETLRDDEDFTDVTIACEGQRLQAHKIVLSACSPFFKELFKTNPCTHPIIFMRDVEARHIIALMEFMYAGEVNVAQAHLSAFLRTAESLKIRGLTDTCESALHKEEDTIFLNPQSKNSSMFGKNNIGNQISSTSTVTSSQEDIPSVNKHNINSPPSKRQCKSESELPRLQNDEVSVSPSALQNDVRNQRDLTKHSFQPKVEIPDYLSDIDNDDNADTFNNLHVSTDVSEIQGGMEIIPQTSGFGAVHNEIPHHGNDNRKLHSLDPRPCEECGRVYSNLSNLRQHMKLIHYPTYVTCQYCKKQFKTDLYLRRHIISTHSTANKNFVRSISFTDNTNNLQKSSREIKCNFQSPYSQEKAQLKYRFTPNINI